MTVAPGPSGRRLRTQQELLAVIRGERVTTRADLSRLTGLSRSAVTTVVQSLIVERLVIETDTDDKLDRGRGRRATRLSLAPRAGHVIGVDFGHAHVAVALADTTGTILAECRNAVDVDGLPHVALDRVADLVRTVLTSTGLRSADVLAASAGIPGPVDRRRQRVRSATILSKWLEIEPATELSRRLGVPVVVDNDANQGALGEHRFGAGRPYQDFLYLKTSHGIGAGIVLNGRTYSGSVGIAGEIGHTQIPGATAWCRCGSHGCLEAVVSVQEVRRQLGPMRGATGPDGAEIPLSELARNPAAAGVFTEAGRTIGRVLADITNVLNPAAIIIGGDLGEAGEPLVVGIRESIDRHSQPSTARCVTVLPAELGARAEVVGAVAAAIDYVNLAELGVPLANQRTWSAVGPAGRR